MAKLETELGPTRQALHPPRRTVVATIAVACAATCVPQAWADGAPPAYTAFLAVSQYLTGHAALDAGLARRAFDALSADDKSFTEQIQRLYAFISTQHPEPLDLQSRLDTARAPFAALPRRIAKAWFLGIVGDGERARCIAFENNLTNRVVADHLRPPSYCFGAYGSWSQKPA